MSGAAPFPQNLAFAAVALLALLAVSTWCALADELGRQARKGRCGRVHARVAWGLAALSGLLAWGCFALLAACPR